MEQFARLTSRMALMEVTYQPATDELHAYKLLTCRVLAKFLREEIAPAIILPAIKYEIKMTGITAIAWLAGFQSIDITDLGDAGGYFLTLAHDIELRLAGRSTVATA